jgi:hypothetical protein
MTTTKLPTVLSCLLNFDFFILCVIVEIDVNVHNAHYWAILAVQVGKVLSYLRTFLFVIEAVTQYLRIEARVVSVLKDTYQEVKFFKRLDSRCLV